MIRGLAAALFLVAVPALADLPKRTVAVTYFDIHGGSDDFKPLGKGMADMLITDLLVVKSITLVERAKLNLALDELKLAKSPFVDPATAVKLGKGLSATHMLTGAITIAGPKMRIDARVLEVQSGKVMQGKQVEGESQEFFALEKELVELLVGALDLKPDLQEKKALRKSQTESFDAIASYAKGLDALDKGDKAGAQAAFATAAKADPAWPALRDALDSLTRELDAADARGAQTLDAKLQALRAGDPDLYKKVEALAKPREISSYEHWKLQLQVLSALMKQNLKPWKDKYVGFVVGASPREHWEAEELTDVIGSFGDDPHALPAVPVLLEYLVRKYSDDPTLLRQLHQSLDRWKSLITAEKLAKPVPEYWGSGDNVDRQKAHHAFLTAAAKAAPLPAGSSRDPLAALARVEQLLVKEAERRKVEFTKEIDRYFSELSTTDVKKLNTQYNALENYISQSNDDRGQQARLQVRLVRWLVDHPQITPYSGPETAQDPLEIGDMEQLFVRYDGDPDSWELIPPAAEYLLRKFPNARNLTSSMRRTLERIDEKRKDVAAAKREWEREAKSSREKDAAPEVRALFKHAGALGKKLKK